MANKPEGLSLGELLNSQKQSNLNVSSHVAKQLKALEDQEKDLKELNASATKKTGDGLNSNVLKMVEELKKSNTFLKKQVDAKNVLDKVGDRREFKTIGQRIGGIKENVKDFFSMRGFLDKTGIVKRGSGGIFSEALDAREDRQKYAKARIAAGDPTVRLHGEEGARKIFENQRKEQQQLIREKNKNEAKIDEYKKLNISERQIAASPEAKALEDIAKRLEKIDPSVRSSDEKTQKENASASSKTDESNDSESEIENSQKLDNQIELLSKIEENTRSEKVTPSKPEEGESKGGMLSGLLGGMKGVGGALSGAAKGLLALAASVWIISKAMQNFASVKIGDFLMGVGAIAALTFAASKLEDSDASKTLLGLGAALWITSKAFENFANVSFGDFLMGVGAIAALTIAVKALDGTSGGVAALIALGAGIWIISKAFENFASIGWADMLKGIAVIGLLGAGLALLSPLAIPIGIISAAFLVFGAALWVISKAFENIAESFPAFTEGLQKLADIGGAELLGVAAGIVAIGAAMAVFGAAQMVAALENLVTKFLSLGDDSPVEQLEKIGKSGDGIQKAATGLERLAAAMKAFGDVDEDALDAAVEAAEDIADATAPAATSTAQPTKKAPMTNAAPSVSTSSESVSGTLKGVTGEQVKSHPNYKKYYDQAISEGLSPIEAAKDATDSVKTDMVKEQSSNNVAPKQVTPQPVTANKVYGESAKVAEADKQVPLTKPTSIVNAPTQVNNQTQNASFKAPIRNQDNTLMGYLKNRFA